MLNQIENVQFSTTKLLEWGVDFYLKDKEYDAALDTLKLLITHKINTNQYGRTTKPTKIGL